jgi:hypothetical protein
MKLKKWVNPKTNETRIYVNGAAGYGVSVFVVDGGTTGHYESGRPEIVVFAKDWAISQSEIDAIMDRVDQFVDENRAEQPTPWACPKFSDYLALAA